MHIQNRFLSAFLSLALILGLFPIAAQAAEDPIAETDATSYEVGTYEQLSSAVASINDAESGKFIIKLTADITAKDSIIFRKNQTIILGQGHTLKLNYTLEVKDSGTSLTLGASDRTDTLTVSGQKLGRTTAMIHCTDAVLNMYSGVTICDAHNSGGAAGSGLFVMGTFNMYGGTIRNCIGETIGLGGAVALCGGVFHLYDGEITENHVSGYGYGAGVVVYSDRGSDCTFYMDGGRISRNTAGGSGLGGGVCVMSDNADATFIMSGGTIEENSAEVGGGIYNWDGTINMSGGIIRDNTAIICADDLLARGGSYDLIAPDHFGKLSSSGRYIDGWYEDGRGNGKLRWNQPIDPKGEGLDLDGDGTPDMLPDGNGCYDLDGDKIGETHCKDDFIRKLVIPSQIPSSESVALKAAHGRGYTVSFEANGGAGTMDRVSPISGEYTLPACSFTAPDGKYFLAWAAGSADGDQYGAGAAYQVGSDITFYAVWEDIPSYTLNVSASPAGAGTASGGGSYRGNSLVTVTASSNSGYTFEKWMEVNGADLSTEPSYTFALTRDTSLVAVFRSTGSGGNGPVTYPVIVEDTENGEVLSSHRYAASGTTVRITVMPDDGFELKSLSATDRNGNQLKLTDRGGGKYVFTMPASKVVVSASFRAAPARPLPPTDTGVSGWLNTSDHIAYLHGYDTGEFGPNDNMTRAQAAQMFYNLLLDKDVPTTADFSDIPDGAWYENAANTLAALEIMVGTGANQFEPDRPITRAEFTVAAMRFAKLPTDCKNIFPDVKESDWFYVQVVGSIKYGWITGYTDGNFHPNNTITRAEVTAIVNRMLGRSADVDFVDDHALALRQFPDISRGYWAYYDICEAVNAHEYDKTGSTENWSKLS